MFPLYDTSQRFDFMPPVTLAIVLVNLVLFLISIASSNYELLLRDFALVPSNIVDFPSLVTLVTSSFFHAGPAHLIGNMWYLWIFGRAVEKGLGVNGFFFFYLFTAIMSGISYLIFIPAALTHIPVLGASGAISGVLGAYLVLFPSHRIRTLFVALFRVYFLNVPAFLFLVLWFLLQLWFALTEEQSTIAYSSHIGGFLAGVCAAILVKKKIRLDEREETHGV